jgi:NADH-quinone oxidoreductase subunit L
MLEYAWVIPAITFTSFWLILFFGKKLPMKGSEIGVGALALCFFLSLAMGGAWISRDASQTVVPHGDESAASGDHAEEGEGGGGGDHRIILPAPAPSVAAAVESGGGEGEHHEYHIRPAVQREVTWFSNGQIDIKAGIHIDGLAVSLLFVVSTISLLVHVFSTSYVHGDERYTHYFAFLSLFTTGMFVLVTASNTLQALFGWELMGLCSFGLIGHWWEEYPNARAALKAFFTTRTGDVGLLVGISILFFAAGQTFDIATTNAAAIDGGISDGVLLAAAVALLIAVIGKSAQFPLHTWLPDAMAGPTPVSALIHAATMVVAGVYLVARLYGVFWEAFDIGAGGINAVALVGGITILIAAALAFVQRDIKKVLAYSTVSQLGFMVMALGVGAWTAAIFHLFTHAFFKACLFLGAGSVSHSGSHHSFDMVADMGGLKKYMPKTFWTFIIATGALAGIPPLAGFWSKDEILLGAGEGGYGFFLVVGLVGACTWSSSASRAVPPPTTTRTSRRRRSRSR